MNADQITHYPLLRGLDETEIEALASRMVKRHFAKGSYIYYPGHPGLNLYLIESGTVRIFFANAQGKEFILNLIGQPACVGLPLLMNDQARLTGAAALRDTVLLSLGQETVFDLMKRSPRFMLNTYLEMSNMLRLLSSYTHNIITLSLPGRVAGLFLHLSENDPTGVIELPLSQSEMASWVGSSRGQINRVLAKMQQSGLIRVDGQKFLILDRQRLTKMAEV